jgi:hypothetical protein
MTSDDVDIPASHLLYVVAAMAAIPPDHCRCDPLIVRVAHLQTLRIAGLKLRQRGPKYNEQSISRYKDTSSKQAHGSPACFHWLSSGENVCSMR